VVEERLFQLLSVVEEAGVWLSVLAWCTVVGGVITLAYVLRNEKRGAVWAPASVVGAVALVANLTDYFVTLSLSPDLSLEANPLWRNVVDQYGLAVAKWYGLTGKIFVSVLAAQMMAFYLSNRERLFPAYASSLYEFLLRLGNRSKTLRERLAALFTLFAFFFAGIHPFYFYITYLNWLQDPEVRSPFPSVPVAVFFFISLLAVVFAAVTYRSFRFHSLHSDRF